MNPELKELYRATIAQKDNEIATLKARIKELEALVNRLETSSTNTAEPSHYPQISYTA